MCSTDKCYFSEVSRTPTCSGYYAKSKMHACVLIQSFRHHAFMVINPLPLHILCWRNCPRTWPVPFTLSHSSHAFLEVISYAISCLSWLNSVDCLMTNMGEMWFSFLVLIWKINCLLNSLVCIICFTLFMCQHHSICIWVILFPRFDVLWDRLNHCC